MPTVKRKDNALKEFYIWMKCWVLLQQEMALKLVANMERKDKAWSLVCDLES